MKVLHKIGDQSPDEKARVLAMKVAKEDQEYMTKLMKQMRILPQRPREEEQDVQVSWGEGAKE